jgi:hypothetical protein
MQRGSRMHASAIGICQAKPLTTLSARSTAIRPAFPASARHSLNSSAWPIHDPSLTAESSSPDHLLDYRMSCVYKTASAPHLLTQPSTIPAFWYARHTHTPCVLTMSAISNGSLPPATPSTTSIHSIQLSVPYCSLLGRMHRNISPQPYAPVRSLCFPTGASHPNRGQASDRSRRKAWMDEVTDGYDLHHMPSM